MAPPPTLAAWRRVDRGRALADLTSEPVVVAPTDPCEAVDVGFRTRWTVSSVLVAPREPGGPHGLVARKDFLTTMTGRYGFGRSLWGRRPVAEVARWDAPRVPVSASLTEAAERLAQSDGYSDMVVLGPDDEPVGVLDPTTLMEALASELAHEASHDHLTGVPSRAWFVDGLRELCARAQRGEGAVVLAFVDLDRLKEVNDSLGHAAGDALLHSVAERLAAAALPGDVVGRLGGDEFALARLLEPQTAAAPWRSSALGLGETLRAALAASDPALPAAAHSRASVGLAVGAGPLVDSDRLLREADLAMYGAKKAGGDRVRLAGADLATADGRVPRQGRGDGARHDDDRGRAAEGSAWWGLEVHYQPIARTADGVAREVEALLRCRDDDGELGGPAEPLARAAAAGRALDLDLWVLAAACRDLAGWRATLGDRAPETVNVNLSPAALDEPLLADRVLRVLTEVRVAPGTVRLELSEAATDAQLARAQPALRELRAAGVPIALDDLGAAFGALRQVTRLPVDAVKIDREVVAHMLDDPVDALIVELVHRLAADRGLPVVAEGVETAEQVDALRAAGVPLMQGFHVARPMPPDALAAYLAR
ncbi:bifunctional diguanylate cyclase/phosphodiesterase [Cellulomonas sp. C5510]|uniref:putative bifunctional diguanylate cyclase/phosphodiesterase n=1 Tax=Cellulomonas sp. C5510 TaxID=2871170 RepID=UPI001C93BE76|nr:EAL domain-containing protein [Cellulomonas sp. C5510]QZN84522.1 EAL domain-containing protein [Cellulomonas sp. C5510]